MSQTTKEKEKSKHQKEAAEKKVQKTKVDGKQPKEPAEKKPPKTKSIQEKQKELSDKQKENEAKSNILKNKNDVEKGIIRNMR